MKMHRIKNFSLDFLEISSVDKMILSLRDDMLMIGLTENGQMTLSSGVGQPCRS